MKATRCYLSYTGLAVLRAAAKAAPCWIVHSDQAQAGRGPWGYIPFPHEAPQDEPAPSRRQGGEIQPRAQGSTPVPVYRLWVSAEPEDHERIAAALAERGGGWLNQRRMMFFFGNRRWGRSSWTELVAPAPVPPPTSALPPVVKRLRPKERRAAAKRRASEAST